MSLKLFVWEDVLEDYSSGLVCVLAHNEKEAWQELYKIDVTAYWVLQGEPKFEGEGGYGELTYEKLGNAKVFTSMHATRPNIVTEPKAFCVWGGG